MFLSYLNDFDFVNAVAKFLHKLGGNRITMASEDRDLIDLGNDLCVARVSINDPISDEQEHLLDVCPPKLEQKLSLTLKQEQIKNDSDNGDVLVTLGHDQVVPIRKRIDVVSSDTIKRIRDITRNLEPVIRRTCSGIVQDRAGDVVDHGTDSDIVLSTEDDTFEEQEINSAFDFLAEHEDADDRNDGNRYDDVAGSNRSISSSARPLIDKCESSVLDNRRLRRNTVSYDDIQLDNPAFESSIYEVSSCSGNKATANSRYVDFDLEPRDKCKRRPPEESVFLRECDRRSFQSVNNHKSWAEGTKARGSVNEIGRINRSVSLDEAARSCEPVVGFFIGKGPPDEELTIRSEEACSECSEVDWSWLEEVESLRATSGTSDRGAGSPANERFELVGRNASSLAERTTERMRDTEDRLEGPSHSAAMSVTASTGKPLVDDRSPSDNLDIQTNNNNNNNNNNTNNGTFVVNGTNDEIETESRCNDANNELESSNNSNENNNNSNNSNNNRVTSSWIRASMRRLRHLRLPEGTLERRQHRNAEQPTNRRTAIVSAPNSLPDIALVAPDILAAQTNGTLGHHLRPSSAPAINRNNNLGNNNAGISNNGNSINVSGSGSGNGGNVATPSRRLGRQHGGAVTNTTTSPNDPPPTPSPSPVGVATPTARSRCISNALRDASSSVQGSVTSTTTGSDATGSSGTTTCSSSSNGSPASTATSPQRAASRRTCERQRGVDRDADRGEDDDEDENPLGKWPHDLSSALACIGCTLGLFNISRFAILSIQFGANFIVQFLILSLILGVPILTLQVCLGQRLATGSVDMWKISPLFQGVGIALLTAQAFIGIYSIVGVSWMFVYFRDSFITKQDKYRWAEPFFLYREDSRPTHNNTNTYKLYETVPDYFNGVVLQRHHLNDPDPPAVVTLKFQVAFNLAVVWMIVFVSLSKGLRSYGKVVYVFTFVPICGMLILCTKLLGLTPPGTISQLFPATVWNEFFINGKSWMAASTEVFFTWGLFGAAAMQIAAHNKHKHLLQRDTGLVVVLTFAVLLLVAFLANTCVQILKIHGYIYTTSSFERISGYTFMRLVNQPAPSWYTSTPERFMSHTSFLVGQRVNRPGAEVSTESGYQVLRFSTELVPATLALLGTEQVSPFWAVLFYFVLILFGIAQQLAIWHCVITGIMAINTKMMKLWDTSITFFSCACAYMMGLPMATELGIYVVYYLDYTVGGAWWIMVLYLIQVGVVFGVRGRPHSGEAVVAELFPPTGRCLRHWAGPLLSFTWNVILPVTLMVLSITVFKSNGFRELYSYRRTSRDYWAVWARQLGAAIQLIPILTIPAVAIIQTCRYLNNGPPDIFDRIQLLYRPALETDDSTDPQTQISGNETSTSIHGNGILPATTDIPFEDPPPKYTPPPSYTTATGARIAKMLRQSFRRSVRRIANVLGESSAPRQRPALQQPPPPDYATVLVEMNQNIRGRGGEAAGGGAGGSGGGGSGGGDVSININNESRPDVIATTDVSACSNPISNTAIGANDRTRPNTIDRMTRINSLDDNNRRITLERTHSTMERGTRGGGTCSNNFTNGNTMISTVGGSPNLTAADVANLLRSSIRRGTVRTQQSLRRSFCQDEPTAAVSVQNLVEAAAPIGQDSLVLPKDLTLVPNEHVDDDRDDKKTADEMDNSISVI